MYIYLYDFINYVLYIDDTIARSHEVTSIVQGIRFDGNNLTVMIATDNVDYLFAQAIAVSRAFPLYHAKSSTISPLLADRRIHVVMNYHGSDVICDWEARIEEISAVADSIRLCACLVDTPPNELNCKTYIQKVHEVCTELNCPLQVIHGSELRDHGLGGLWGVGKAAEYPPALAILSHLPSECSPESKSICLVGKGIVYDTGGLSVKIGGNMCGMKGDMGGSAGVLGAFQAIVKCNLKSPVHALLCIAENSIGPMATRPDDIHTFYSGKTVEINNTDAEGRLVLGDGVAYAYSKLNPRIIIDMATLTGAQLVATGRRHAAIESNSDNLDMLAQQMGRYSGDLVHPIPYCPEFFKSEFASTVADMKNSVKDRSNAQSSCAGQFIANHIEDFINNGGEWLHVDMAGPVSSNERGTGYGVALLYSLVKMLSLH